MKTCYTPASNKAGQTNPALEQAAHSVVEPSPKFLQATPRGGFFRSSSRDTSHADGFDQEALPRG